MTTRTQPGVFGTPAAIPEALRLLRETPVPESGVLSVYLDTSIGQAQGQAYLLTFRAAAKAIREGMQGTAAPERKAFEQAVEQADSYLLHLFVPRHPGLALFAGSNAGYFIAVPLPQRPLADVAWADQPQVSQLKEALDDYERVAVALVDKQTLRLFTVYLGQIQEHHTLESELIGKKAAGDWPHRVRTSPPLPKTDVPGQLPAGTWVGMIEGRQERRHYEYAQRHSRLAAHALVELLRAEPFDRLFLAGPEEPAHMLEQSLPRPLRTRLTGILSLPVAASETEVLQATLAATEVVERQEELGTVKRLIAEATSPRVALGLDATLEAASLGSIDRLVVADTLAAAGGQCPQCGRLVLDVDRCPTCGTPSQPVDLRERLVEQALAQGARIEFVSGEAAELLASHGGAGAFVRY